MRAWVRAHRWLCGLVAATLLFAQTLGVVHACSVPGEAATGIVERKAAPTRQTQAQAQVPAVHEGCEMHRAAAVDDAATEAAAGSHGSEHDAGPTLQCKAHCQSASQSVNTGWASADVPAAAATAVALWPLMDAEAQAQPLVERPGAQAVGPPEGTPPLFITLQVLRN